MSEPDRPPVDPIKPDPRADVLAGAGVPADRIAAILSLAEREAWSEIGIALAAAGIKPGLVVALVNALKPGPPKPAPASTPVRANTIKDLTPEEARRWDTPTKRTPPAGTPWRGAADRPDAARYPVVSRSRASADKGPRLAESETVVGTSQVAQAVAKSETEEETNPAAWVTTGPITRGVGKAFGRVAWKHREAGEHVKAKLFTANIVLPRGAVCQLMLPLPGIADAPPPTLAASVYGKLEAALLPEWRDLKLFDVLASDVLKDRERDGGTWFNLHEVGIRLGYKGRPGNPKCLLPREARLLRERFNYLAGTYIEMPAPEAPEVKMHFPLFEEEKTDPRPDPEGLGKRGCPRFFRRIKFSEPVYRELVTFRLAVSAIGAGLFRVNRGAVYVLGRYLLTRCRLRRQRRFSEPLAKIAAGAHLTPKSMKGALRALKPIGIEAYTVDRGRRLQCDLQDAVPASALSWQNRPPALPPPGAIKAI